MPLSAGAKLGPYEILALIGEGGMGEVYKARDTRLDRVVAIKLSKSEFTERFDREARAVAALNHPNICQLYDVGPNYLVMEFIEGLELRGPLPLDKAIPYATQVLDALHAAHRKRITHRDLKPANIIVTPQGIKLLDFGLAKLDAPLAATDATLVASPTTQGQIVGTLQYMSPEQLQSKPVDARSDIFSFGCVLYEMLTGRRAFEGGSTASVIAAILDRQPEPAHLPPPLERILATCLAKDPDQRFQDALDLKRDLLWAIERQPSDTPTPSVNSRLPHLIAALALAALAALAVAYHGATRPPGPKPLVRLDVDLGASVLIDSTRGADVVLSPDGTRIAYVAKDKLLTRKLDQPRPIELAATDGAAAPFFSPDGQWIGFFAEGKLKKLPADGGAPVALWDAPSGFGASWGEDGNIVVSHSNQSPLMRFPSAGGPPTPLTELAPGEVTHRWPQVLPGGNAVLFTSSTTSNGPDGSNIEVISLQGNQPSSARRKLLMRGAFGRFFATSTRMGHLAYLRESTLFAVPFDPKTLEIHGTPVPVLEQVAFNPRFGSARLDASLNGMFVYRTGGVSGLVTVQWLTPDGKFQPILAKPNSYSVPRLSPDGLRLSLELIAESNRDVWLYDSRRDTLSRLTFNAGSGSGMMNPVWTPDGRHIVFMGRGGIFATRSDGAGAPQQLTSNINQRTPVSISPDGKRLAFSEQAHIGLRDIWTLPLEHEATGLKGGKPEPFLQTPADERSPMFSPDGRWLAYVSNESGAYQVYVRSFPGREGKWQISTAGGSYPVWSSNGRDLFFRAIDNRIMVAGYTASVDSFSSGKPRLWSPTPLADFGPVGTTSYDVAPDGKRIVALMPVAAPEAQHDQNHIVFLLNFFDELRRKVPLPH